MGCRAGAGSIQLLHRRLQGHAPGAENPAAEALHVGSGPEALAVLPDFHEQQALPVVDDLAPLRDLHPGRQARLQSAARQNRQGRTDDVATDRLLKRGLDRPGM